MLKIFYFLITMSIFISCEKKFEVPQEYSCLNYKEVDSIVNSYRGEKNLKPQNFKTFLGFKLNSTKKFNDDILSSKANSEGLISISNNTTPFEVNLIEYRNTICSIQIEIAKEKKYLANLGKYSPDSGIITNIQNEIDIENNRNIQYENISTTFNQLFQSLTNKYGKYNFYEDDEMTKGLFPTYYKSYFFKRYYWIIADVLICLKNETFVKEIQHRVQKDITIKNENEYVVILYESILNSNARIEEINEEWENEMLKDSRKSEAKKRHRDSVSNIEQNKIDKEI